MELSGLGRVLLHSSFDCLLGATNVGFLWGCGGNGVGAAGLVNHNSIAAVVVVVAAPGGPVLAVAGPGGEVSRAHFRVEFGGEVGIEDFT